MTCVVTIPVYQSTLSTSERLSLTQATRVLSRYDIVLFGPEGLDMTPYLAICPQARVVRFEASYFEGIAGYNRLMFSPLFYRTFWEYDYLLIYQLDAYVFKDDLQAWCNRGYDYVGAPWTLPPPLTKKPIVNIQKCFVNRVGNGGLSLRKVKSHYRNVLFFKPLLRFFLKNEDMFWGLALYFLNPFFRRPSAQEALSFAFELAPRQEYERNGHQLPFGVHAWEKYDAGFWEKFIP
ncbi:MAG: hypothetical protein MUE30_14665 [Spirosomaceae bacterium]|jgi:hypothetical protein|nr:hypothetical protein [Spirosomataceae bacterium]